MECLICFENIKKNYVVLQCGHRFHQKCIQQWEYHLISRNQVLTCPCCRKEQSHARSLLFFIKRKKTHREKFVYLVYKFILKKPYY